MVSASSQSQLFPGHQKEPFFKVDKFQNPNFILFPEISKTPIWQSSKARTKNMWSIIQRQIN
jgi:hypothetical protein